MASYCVDKETCEAEGTHLVETDNDGYCLDCGYQ